MRTGDAIRALKDLRKMGKGEFVGASFEAEQACAESIKSGEYDTIQITYNLLERAEAVADTIDPLAGSYMIESLTSQIEDGAKKYIDKIDELGGVIKAIETGYIQNEIQNSAYQHQKDVEKGEQVVVGLNKFTVEEKPLGNLLRVDPEKERFQKEKLAKVKAERDNSAVQSALKKLQATAQGSENLLHPTLEAVKAYATLGEIADVLRGVFGEYRER